MLTEEIKQLIPYYLPFCTAIDGRYKKLSKLGEGRYGKVFLCYDLYFENLVAVKTLRTSDLRSNMKNFFNEVVTLARISSFDSSLKTPKVIEFNLNGVDDSGKLTVYYVMEFIEMGELTAVLETVDFISEKLACFFFRQLCDNLLILHSNNLLHLDLKPENILMDGNGNLHFCDFGSSVFVNRENSELDLTQKSDVMNPQDQLKASTDSNQTKRKNQTNKQLMKIQKENYKNVCLNFSTNEFMNFVKNTRFMVTPGYAAPEIKDFEDYQNSLKHNSLLDAPVPNLSKLDVFSLGVILFFIVMKAQPFQNPSKNDAYYQRFSNDKEAFWKIFANLRTVSKEFKDIIIETLQVLNKNRIDLLTIYKHNWMTRHFPSDDHFYKIISNLNAFKRNHLTQANQCHQDLTSKQYLSLYDQKLEDDSGSQKSQNISTDQKSANESVSLSQELFTIINRRKKQLYEQIESDLKQKEQKQKSKRFNQKYGNNSMDVYLINAFIQKHHLKILSLKKFVSCDEMELLESVISTSSDQSSSSGDGR